MIILGSSQRFPGRLGTCALPSPRKIILLLLDDEIGKGRLRHRELVLVKLELIRKNNIRKTIILAAVV